AVVDRAGPGLGDGGAGEAGPVGAEAAVDTVAGGLQCGDGVVGGVPPVLHDEDIERCGHGSIIRPRAPPPGGQTVTSTGDVQPFPVVSPEPPERVGWAVGGLGDVDLGVDDERSSGGDDDGVAVELGDLGEVVGQAGQP